MAQKKKKQVERGGTEKKRYSVRGQPSLQGEREMDPTISIADEVLKRRQQTVVQRPGDVQLKRLCQRRCKACLLEKDPRGEGCPFEEVLYVGGSPSGNCLGGGKTSEEGYGASGCEDQEQVVGKNRHHAGINALGGHRKKNCFSEKRTTCEGGKKGEHNEGRQMRAHR